MLQIGAINNYRVPIIFHSRVWYANQKASHMPIHYLFLLSQNYYLRSNSYKNWKRASHDFLVRLCKTLNEVIS